MNRRQFLTLTGTFTGGTLLLPDFLHAFGSQQNLNIGEQCLVFIQLNGGNDGLNTFIPYEDPLYYDFRPKIAISKLDVISASSGMAFHPALKNFANMQQDGQLSVIQNVGYPDPVRSHFRSQEIWQTAADSNEYLDNGWLGRYLDLQCKEHNPTAAVNIDTINNLALRGQEPNSITVRDPSRMKYKPNEYNQSRLSENPQLDFVRKVANSAAEGSEDIRVALSKVSASDALYPKTDLAKNLEWISKLIKGNLNSKVYYTSLNGFDTHDNQLPLHKGRLSVLNDAVFGFYSDMKKSRLLSQVTVVVFSEFGRRVKDNGRGTDHGTAAPMFVIGGNNKGQIIGKNPDLINLSRGDLQHDIDFRSVYAALLNEKMDFNPKKIGISNAALKGLF